MKNIDVKKLVIALIIPFLAAAVGSGFTTSKIQSWYAMLDKPFFSPPNWLFGPVWTILYIMMGVSLYLVWMKKPLNNKIFKWFWIQLGLNTLWSILFFGMEKPGLALIEILILWVSIRMTMKNFAVVGSTPVRLLYPYLAWVSFATILNVAIWWLNR